MKDPCQKHERSIKAWLDGELRAGRAADVERHLAACPRCRATAAAWESIAERIRDGGSGDPAPLSLARLRFRIEAERGAERITIRSLQGVAAAAAAVLLVALGALFYRGGPEESESTPWRDSVMEVVLGGGQWGDFR